MLNTSQFPNPVYPGEVLQSSEHPGGPPMALLQQLHISLVLGAPDLDVRCTSLDVLHKMEPHKVRAQREIVACTLYLSVSPIQRKGPLLISPLLHPCLVELILVIFLIFLWKLMEIHPEETTFCLKHPLSASLIYGWHHTT